MQRENAQLREQVENIAQQKHIENITLEEFQQLTYKFCPREFAAFINIQLSQIQKKPKGRRYSNDFKTFCLTVYFMGPKLYKKIIFFAYQVFVLY